MKQTRNHFSFQFIRNSSSNSPKWNSTTNPNLKIRHPTLLLIESCNSMSTAKQIQAQMTRTGLIHHLFPVSRLLSFIALDKKGNFTHATTLFSQIPQPNAYIWNTMIRGCVRNSLFDTGFRYFSEMVKENLEMDERSYVFGVKACEGLDDFGVGEMVHCRIWKVGFIGDVVVRNGLIRFYCERGELGCARRVFYESGEVRDVVSWTSLIDGCVRNAAVDGALEVFDEMCASGTEPNEVTMVAVFSACTQKGDLGVGERIRGVAETRGVVFSLNMMNAMLDMYVKCGGLAKGREVFERMEEKDVFSWTSMINGYARHGEVEMAREFFDEMLERNVVSWNAMIAGYSQNCKPTEALGLFHKMEIEGLNPMESTLVSVLSACAQSGHMDIGQRIYNYYLKQKGFPLTVILGNAFIDMYAKCGNIVAAREIFNEMKRKDLVTYNSMIVAYASHGHADKALSLFEHIAKVGFKPDDITLVGILSACAHGGLVKKGWDYFNSMELFGLTPAMEHYACMSDLLGRAGLLEEAYELIKSMPMEPDEGVWGAFLNGCRMHGNVELGKLGAEKLMTLEPKDSGTYVLLASLLANKRKWGDVKMARSLMRDKGIKKTRGSSLIEVEGEFHEFLAADESHRESKAIYNVLAEILFFSKPEECTSVSYHIEAC